ncbi:MAG: rhodanese-like domain-containing protein [Candidatus Thiodiazotropha sp.]
MQDCKSLLGIFSLGVLSWTHVWAVDLPGPVVDTQWLARNQTDVQIIDIRSDTESFTTQPEVGIDEKTGDRQVSRIGGHIANSLAVDYPSVRSEKLVDGQTIKYLVPEATRFETLMQQAGVDSGKPMVIVSSGVNAKAVDEGLRLYWQLKYFGEDQVSVLDGGFAAWIADGHEVSVEPGLNRTGNWKARSLHPELAATPDEIAQRDASVQLIDARSTAQHYGFSKKDYVYAYGHIQDSKSVPPDVLYRQDGSAVKFYSPDAYRTILAISGVDINQPAIVYCNSGHMAAGPWFIEHELMGNSRTRLFDGSMHQWTVEKRPVVSVSMAPMPQTCSAGVQSPGC